MNSYIKTIITALNTSAWILLLASLLFNWAIITQRIEVLGYDSLTRAMTRAGRD